MAAHCTRREFLRRSMRALAAAGLWRVFGIAPAASAPTSTPTTPHSLAMDPPPAVLVIGVGHAGGQAITRMARQGIAGAALCVADTNVCPALYLPATRHILLGPHLARGLGAGGYMEHGAAAAEASTAELRSALAGAELALIVAGMGGGTGGGAAPVVARLAREAGALAVALVTMPFKFEGRRRQANALAGVATLRAAAGAVIAVPCDGILPTHHHRSLSAGFAALDDLLSRAARSLVETLTVPGLIGVDPQMLQPALGQPGYCRLGVGQAAGQDGGRRAAEAALASPFLGGPLAAAPGLFFAVRGGVDVTLGDVLAAGETLEQAARADACLLCGATVDPALPAEQVEVTLIAAGAPDATPFAGQS